MQIATRSAVFLAPIPLRILLAVTFLWAGFGKIAAEMPVKGEQAALLANMGLRLSATKPPSQPEAAPKPTKPSPDPSPESSEPTPADPEPSGDIPDASARAHPRASITSRSMTVQQTATTYTASDFPEPVRVKRVYGLALLTYQAAHPLADEQGNPGVQLWPDWAVRDKRPIYIAWAAAITECLAGVLVLIGLLTRIGAIMIAGVMATAMWLTEIGPAIQASQTHLGFLPAHDLWDTAAWKTLLWQFSLFGAALALLFAGPGALSLDRTPDHDLDDEDDEP